MAESEASQTAAGAVAGAAVAGAAVAGAAVTAAIAPAATTSATISLSTAWFVMSLIRPGIFGTVARFCTEWSRWPSSGDGCLIRGSDGLVIIRLGEEPAGEVALGGRDELRHVVAVGGIQRRQGGLAERRVEALQQA